MLYSAAWDGGPVGIYAASKEYPESRSLLKNGVLLSVSAGGDMAVLASPLPIDHYEYLGRSTPTPGIWRLEIATGRRQLAQEIKLADPVGVNIIIPAAVTPDGDSSAIYFTRRLDVLYLATGLN